MTDNKEKELAEAINKLTGKIHQLDLRIVSVCDSNEHQRREFKMMAGMIIDTQKKHNDSIYGNGKDGLVTRASLTEDNIEKLEEEKESNDKKFETLTNSCGSLKNKLSYHRGKLAGIVIGASALSILLMKLIDKFIIFPGG